MKVDHLMVAAAGVAGLVGAVYLLRGKIGSAVAETATAAAQAVNPLNRDNVFAKGADAVTAAVTGTPNSLGTWLAEKFDPTTRAADASMRAKPVPPAYTTADRDDREAGTMMQSIIGKKPMIDLGAYSETVALDDMEMTKRYGVDPFAPRLDTRVFDGDWRTQWLY